MIPKSFIEFNGEPRPLSPPTVIRTFGLGALDAAWMNQIRQEYARFCDDVSVTRAKFLSRTLTVANKVQAHIVHIQGETKIYVTPLRESMDECSIALDSGAVSLKTSDTLLYHTEFVDAYLAQWGEGPYSKLDGVLDVDSLQGTLSVHGATAPTTKSRKVDKSGYALAPASCFTGKTRLYVQALYGGELQVTAVPETSVPPTVQIPALSGGETVEVTTSCGIYLDQKTSEHWLVKAIPGEVEFYPLVPSECAAKLRPLLRNARVPADAKRRIETYILSTSVPNATKKQVVAIQGGGAMPLVAMGYGLHFNWSGSAADIVGIDYDTITHSHITTHWRLSVSFATTTKTWSATASTVEGPITWRAVQGECVFLYPLWAAGGMIKLPRTFDATQAVDAPLYVYYAGDAEQVVRFQIEITPERTYRISTPSWFGGNVYGWVSDDVMSGERGGVWKDVRIFERQVIKLRCGAGYTTHERKSERTVKHSLRGVIIGWPESPTFEEDTFLADEVIIVKGRPIHRLNTNQQLLLTSPGWHDTFTYRPGGDAGSWNNKTWTLPIGYSVIENTETIRKHSGEVALFVPHYDAEAAYLHGGQTVSVREIGENHKVGFPGRIHKIKATATVGHLIQVGVDSSGYPIYVGYDTTTIFEHLVYHTSTIPGEYAPYDYEYVDNETLDNNPDDVFVYGARKSNFRMPHIQGLYDWTVPYIQQRFSTYTSVEGATYSWQQGVNVANAPMTPDSVDPFVYVGWA